MGYRPYRPRRAPRELMEGAPEWALSCHDAVLLRYVVFFGGSRWHPVMGRRVHYLSVPGDAAVEGKAKTELGICPANARDWSGPRVSWLDLPQHVRARVLAWRGKLSWQVEDTSHKVEKGE